MNCAVENCDRPLYAKGYCNMHWQRWRKKGDPAWCFLMRARVGGPREWIRRHATVSGESCMVWPYARRENGFPKMAGCSPARMMCELAHGPAPSTKHQVAHSCGKGHEGCLAPRHLRWATAKENHADKRAHGTLLRGSKIKQSKLTEADVREIRSLSKSLSHATIAAMFGISRPTITRAINGNTWRHV